MPTERSRTFRPRSPVRSLVYRALLGFAHAAHKMGNGALFTAAGLLRRDELHAASVEQYRVFNLSDVEVDAGLTSAERQFYARFIEPRGRVLLVGCGTGRDMIALQEIGHDVVGLEPIAEVVEIARHNLARRRSAATVRQGLVQSAELGGLYDAVIFSNGCYSFVPGSVERIGALRRVAEHLSPRGRIIISYHPATAQSAAGRWLTRAATRVSGAGWVPEPGDIFSRDNAVRDLIRYHHAFACAELAAECAQAGLYVIANEPTSDGQWFAAAEQISR